MSACCGRPHQAVAEHDRVSAQASAAPSIEETAEELIVAAPRTPGRASSASAGWRDGGGQESADELISTPRTAVAGAAQRRHASAADCLRATRLASAVAVCFTLVVLLNWTGLGGTLSHLPSSSFAHPRRAELIHEETWQDWVEVWQTAQGLGNFQRLPSVMLGADFDMPGPVVDVMPAVVDQEILGFGGAFTESSAVVFKNLGPALQQRFLDLYFGPEGLGLSMGRVHINSCDFSLASYSFDDVWNDYNLTFFDEGVAHDAEALIPLIQRAGEAVRKAGNSLRLLATPWSPPAWMKSNAKMSGSADLPGGGLLKEARGSWAAYIAKWIAAYKAHGVPIWAITVQNEPGFSARWEACTFTAQEEADFLGEFLGPTMKQSHPEVAIFMYDHNKDQMINFALAGLQHPLAWKYITGFAFHWYAGDFFQSVSAIHRDYPQAVLLASEATYEKSRWTPGASRPVDNWSFGEGYAHDIIGDLNAGASGWIDWNLLLDARGGPNHLDNFCDAAIVADVESQVLHLHPQYYFLGHFSKFMPPGSWRVKSKVLRSLTFTGPTRPYGTCSGEDGLQATAALRPDGKIAVVALNCGDSAIHFKLRSAGKAAQVAIPPHAVQTYILPAATQLRT